MPWQEESFERVKWLHSNRKAKAYGWRQGGAHRGQDRAGQGRRQVQSEGGKPFHEARLEEGSAANILGAYGVLGEGHPDPWDAAKQGISFSGKQDTESLRWNQVDAADCTAPTRNPDLE